MNEIMNIGGVDCYEKDGTAYLKLETVARGLGFTTTQNIGGAEYINVRWKRVEEYLEEIGFATSGKRPDFIPENVFYRLAMKAKNETAEKFQALVADEIIPSIRKTGGYQVPKTTGEQIQLLARGYTDLEQAVSGIKEDVSDLKENMPLYGCEIDEVQKHVRRKGVDVLGGKQSPAYHDGSIRTQVYQDLYAQIKREYGCVASYKSIKRKYIEDLHGFIENYEPPTVLAEIIKDCNAQMRIS